MSSEDQPLGFEQQIRPLFRAHDRESMERAFDLWSYDDVVSNADKILQKLDDGSMPCDGPWPAEQVAIFRRWVQAEKPA
jgi:hypothetical protein